MDNQRWLFLGPEHGQKQQEIQNIVSQIKKTHDSELGIKEDIEELKLFVGDLDSDTLKDEIQTTSIFSSIRILKIYQIELFSASDAKIISSALESQDNNTFIFFVSDETRIHASLDKLFSKDQKKIFWSMSEGDYKSFIINKADLLQLQLADEAIELIIFLFGENSMQLENILKLLQVYMTSKKDTDIGTLISREDIERWMSHFKHESIFHVFEMISKKSYEKAHVCLNSLLQSGEHPIQLIAGLIYQLRNALNLKKEIIKGTPKKTALQSMNIKSFSIQKQYIDFVSDCSTKNLKCMLVCCFDTDAELRSGGDSKLQIFLMTKLLYHICMLHSSKEYVPITGRSLSHYNISNTYLHNW